MLVHVVPGVDRRNREVYPDIINADRLAIANGNDQGITFCSEPCMDFSVALNQSAEAEATPDAWRPPTPLIAPDPVYGRRGRERMDYPRLADVGVQDDSVGCRKGAQSFFDPFGRDIQLSCQFRVIRTRSRLDETLNQLS